MSRRLPLHALVLLAIGALCLPAVPARAEDGAAWVREVIAERAEAHGVSAPLLVAVAECESRLDPLAVGDGGLSLGLYQLYAYGLRPAFYQLGYTDVWSAWQQSDFAAWAFAQGYASHWTCYGRVR